MFQEAFTDVGRSHRNVYSQKVCDPHLVLSVNGMQCSAPAALKSSHAKEPQEDSQVSFVVNSVHTTSTVSSVIQGPLSFLSTNSCHTQYWKTSANELPEPVWRYVSGKKIICNLCPFPSSSLSSENLCSSFVCLLK